MGEAKPSRASEAASLRRSLSAIFGFRGRPPGVVREGVEAHQSFAAAPAQWVEAHRDGEFAKAQHEAIGHRWGAGPIVIGPACEAGARALGRRLGTSAGAETPGPHPVPATSQGRPSWLGRWSCSPAQRGCPRGVRRGDRLRALA